MKAVPFFLTISLIFGTFLTVSAQQEISLKSRTISYFDGEGPDISKVEAQPADAALTELVEKVVKAGKGSTNFRIFSAPVGTVIALVNDQGRLLICDPAFLKDGGNMESNWKALGVLAHQIGHLVQFHDLTRQELGEEVLLAERFAGFALYRLGATLEQAKLAIHTYAPEKGTKTHMPRANRIIAIEKAYQEAEAQGGASVSGCPGFADAPNPDEVMDQFALYRDYIRIQDWDLAYDFWKKVYAVAPRADGRRNSVLADGIVLYEHYYREAPDSTEKAKYVDRIFELYDQIEVCFPQSGGYAAGRKAFDLFYQYPNRASRREIYDLFKKSIDQDGMNTNFFVLNPFSSLLVEMYGKGEIDLQEAKAYQQKVRDILAKGLEECKGNACEPWLIIQEYTPARLEAFEAVRGFYDYDYYIDKYFPEYIADSTSCETVTTVYSRLVWGETPKENPKFKRLVAARKEACVPAGTQLVREAYDCLQNADYDCAIEKFESAASETDNTEKKGNYLLLVAKVYQAHKKNFPKAREYALKAAEVRPDWGEPYILVGILYASSGPLCGPGRGWDSQIVTWPAIDKWTKAKQVDPSVSEEANRLIGRYRQYMPSVGDIFQRTLKEGERFFVPCWIQEYTTIRAAK